MIHNRALKRDAVTAAILDEAAKILSEAGPEGLTLHKVADALGYATTAIYRYFESKEAMLVAMQRRALQELAIDLARVIQSDANPLARLAACAYVYAALPKHRPNVFRLIALSLADPRAMMDDRTVVPVGGDIGLLMATLEALFDEAAKLGLISKGKLPRAPILWTQVHGLLVVRKLGRLEGLSALTDDTLVTEALRTQFLGFGADKTTVKTALQSAQRIATEVLS